MYVMLIAALAYLAPRTSDETRLFNLIQIGFDANQSAALNM